MKRMTNEDVNLTVSKYLERRNYSIPFPIIEMRKNDKSQTKFNDIRTIGLHGAIVNEESSSNVISLSSCVHDFNTKAEESFIKFNDFCLKSNEPFKSQLSSLQFPVFVHLFIELFQSGHKANARRLFRDHKSKFNDGVDISYKQVIQKIESTLSNQTLDDDMKTFRQYKYTVRLSENCKEHLDKYLKNSDDLIILQILNAYIDFQLYEFNNHSDHLNSLHNSNDLFINSFKSNHLKHHEDIKSVSTSQLAKSTSSILSTDSNIKDFDEIVDQLNELPSPLPHLFLFNVKSSCLSSALISQDMNMIVGGFEDSSIRLWKLNPYERKPSYTTRNLSQIELAFQDTHDDDQDDMTEDSTTESNNGVENNGVENNDVRNNDIRNYGVRNNGVRNNGVRNNGVRNSSEVSEERTDLGILRSHGGPVYGVSLIPKTNILLSCSEDTTIRAWDISSHDNVAIYHGHHQPIWAIDTVILENYFVTGSKDTLAMLWCSDRTFPLRFYTGHFSDVNCVKIHLTCKYIATGSSDKTVRLWDLQTGQNMRSFCGHRAGVYALAFSPCGYYLLSAGEDRIIKVWDIKMNKLIKEFHGHTDTIFDIAFDPNQPTQFASSGADCSIKLWNFNLSANKGNSSVKNDKSLNQPDLISSYESKFKTIVCTKFMPRNSLASIGTV